MPHDIIDNREQLLVDHIRRILPGSQAAKFAVGYFFLSGLEAVADVLENVAELRLFLGNASNWQFQGVEPLTFHEPRSSTPKRSSLTRYCSLCRHHTPCSRLISRMAGC